MQKLQLHLSNSEICTRLFSINYVEKNLTIYGRIRVILSLKKNIEYKQMN